MLNVRGRNWATSVSLSELDNFLNVAAVGALLTDVEGAYGVVYQARLHEDDGYKHVLKIVALNSKTTAQDFTREVNMLRRASASGFGPKTPEDNFWVKDGEFGFITMSYWKDGVLSPYKDKCIWSSEALDKLDRYEKFLLNPKWNRSYIDQTLPRNILVKLVPTRKRGQAAVIVDFAVGDWGSSKPWSSVHDDKIRANLANLCPGVKEIEERPRKKHKKQ